MRNENKFRYEKPESYSDKVELREDKNKSILALSSSKIMPRVEKRGYPPAERRPPVLRLRRLGHLRQDRSARQGVLRGRTHSTFATFLKHHILASKDSSIDVDCFNQDRI